ncbi:Bacterial regulatory protein, tetR family [compost metagenome]
MRADADKEGRGDPARSSSGAAIEREQTLLRRIIDAAGICVERFGLEGMTVEDIAMESGVSRATLYRKFGNKDAILDALVGQHAAPFADEAIRILMTKGNIAVRIERALMRGVMDLPEQRWLDDALSQGKSSLGTELFDATYRLRVRAVLHLILQSDEIRSGLVLDDVLDWFMRELVLMVAGRPWKEQDLRRRIRHFIVPVLVPDKNVSE